MSKTVKIAIAGEGGQGVQAIAKILTEAAYGEGKEVLYIPNFGVEQRGGVSVAFVQISPEKISALKFQKADTVIALSARAVRRTMQYVDENSIFIYDSSIEGVAEEVAELQNTAKKVLSIPALQIVSEELHPRVFNMLIMGAVIGATKVVSLDGAYAALEHNLGAKFQKDPSLRDMNRNAIGRGYDLIEL